MGSRSVVLSPHFDDAVLSCWHVLTRGGTTVATVFSAVPGSGVSGWWDRLTGASDSAARMEERRREDTAALALAGAEPLALDLLDEQYRTNGRIDGLDEALAGAVGAESVVYAPIGLFLNADHRLVRDAALRLDADVRLYADHPHIGLWGLPAWVTGAEGAAGLDVDAAWQGAMRDAGLDPGGLTPEVHALDDAAFGRKLAAVRTYATQVPALECEAPLDQLRWEVTWTR